MNAPINPEVPGVTPENRDELCLLVEGLGPNTYLWAGKHEFQVWPIPVDILNPAHVKISWYPKENAAQALAVYKASVEGGLSAVDAEAAKINDVFKLLIQLLGCNNGLMGRWKKYHHI